MLDIRWSIHAGQLYTDGYSDMDLDNKEYLQVDLHSNLYCIQGTFVGYQPAVPEIRDIKQQYLTSIFQIWTFNNGHFLFATT